jgi:hypothetical protein
VQLSCAEVGKAKDDAEAVGVLLGANKDETPLFVDTLAERKYNGLAHGLHGWADSNKLLHQVVCDL